MTTAYEHFKARVEAAEARIAVVRNAQKKVSNKSSVSSPSSQKAPVQTPPSGFVSPLASQKKGFYGEVVSEKGITPVAPSIQPAPGLTPPQTTSGAVGPVAPVTKRYTAVARQKGMPSSPEDIKVIETTKADVYITKKQQEMDTARKNIEIANARNTAVMMLNKIGVIRASVDIRNQLKYVSGFPESTRFTMDGKTYTKAETLAEVQRRKQEVSGYRKDIIAAQKENRNVYVENRKNIAVVRYNLGKLKQETPYPEYATFAVEKVGGDEIGLSLYETPEDKLAWNKYYAGQTSSLPPVIKEINQFGQGIISDVLSFVSPVSDIFGKKKEFDIYATIAMTQGTVINPFDRKAFAQNLGGGLKAGKGGIHFITPLDYAFEPIGLSPKGSTEFLNRYPAYTLGGFSGEVASLIAGNLAIGGATKAASKTIKYTLPKLTSTFKTTFPDIASKTIIKIEQTGIGKNVGLWAKGYVPVAKGTERLSSNVFLSKGTGSYLKNIFRQNRLLFEREFVPKSTAKNLMKPTVEMSMAKRGAGYGTSLDITLEKTAYKTSRLGKTTRIYEELKIRGPQQRYVDYAKAKFPMLEQAGEKQYGSLYNLRPTTKPITETERLLAKETSPKVKWLYDVVIPSQKGIGIPYIKSTPKYFLKDTTGEMSTLLSKPGEVSREITSGFTKRGVSSFGKITGQGMKEIFLPVIKSSALGVLSLYGIGVISRGEVQLQPRSDIVFNISGERDIQRNIQAQIPMSIQRDLSAVINVSASKQASLTRQEMKTLQDRILKQSSMSETKLQYKYKYKPYKPYQPIKTKIPFIPIFPGDDPFLVHTKHHKRKKFFESRMNVFELQIPTLKNLFGG